MAIAELITCDNMHDKEKRITPAYRLFTAITGDMKAAVLLQQCIFWCPRGDVFNYFHKSDKEIFQELGLNPHEIYRAIDILKGEDLITTTLDGMPAKRYISINKDNINKALKYIQEELEKTNGIFTDSIYKSLNQQITRRPYNKKTDFTKSENMILPKRQTVIDKEIVADDTIPCFNETLNQDFTKSENMILPNVKSYTQTTSETTIIEKEEKPPTPLQGDFSLLQQPQVEKPKQEVLSLLQEVTREIIDYLNEKADKHFEYNTKQTISYVNCRLKEGRTIQDFKTVIDKKTAKWKGTKQDDYLRPKTLFTQENFESYLNEKTDTQLQPQKPEKLDIFEKNAREMAERRGITVEQAREFTATVLAYDPRQRAAA